MQCTQQYAGTVGGRWSHTALSHSQGHNAIKRRRTEWAGWGAAVAGEGRGGDTSHTCGAARRGMPLAQWQVIAVATGQLCKPHLNRWLLLHANGTSVPRSQQDIQTNIECYNSEFEFEHIIRSSKIRPSFNIPNCQFKTTAVMMTIAIVSNERSSYKVISLLLTSHLIHRCFPP